jgi:CDP-paratose 2-epimerase
MSEMSGRGKKLIHRAGNSGRGRRAERPALITGGCGFIGTNLAARLLDSGRRVRLLDNLSRPGVEKNLRWLRQRGGERLAVEIADVRDADALRRAVRGSGAVFHFAAQVAVTTSLVEPAADFEVNARGTLNVLEAVRAQDEPPPVVFTSTNKVYGGLADVALRLAGQRYQPADSAIAARGFGEDRRLDFHSPYGCSKGAADQYVLDYARSYGLRTVVFRMSCIYGPHQFGTEDQGWVAHFLLRALAERPITLYGDGMQVRDVLFVDDLVRAFLLAEAEIDQVAGRAFNLGGGPRQTLSLLELIDLIGELHGERPAVSHEDWRTGDQRYYVSDVRGFHRATGWTPNVGVREGVGRLYNWLLESEVAAAPRVAAGRTA